jgi:hypothetical protein
LTDRFDICKLKVSMQEMHIPFPLSIQQFRNTSQPATALFGDRPESMWPWNPWITPDTDLITISNTPYEPFLEQIKAMLYTLPGRRCISREHCVLQLSSRIVFCLEHLGTQAVWNSQQPPRLAG